MAIEVIMPQMGESIAEGTLVRWLKKVGERVDRDEPLFEISTDKVDTEIPSPAAGVLEEIKVDEGETVPVQTVVALLSSENGSESPSPPDDSGDSGGATATKEAPKKEAPREDEDDDEPVVIADEPSEPEAKEEAPPPAPTRKREDRAGDGRPAPRRERAESGERRRSSPLVRRIAREHDIDLGDVPGTGSGGRVTKNDILAYIEQRTSGRAAAPAARAPAAAPAAARTPVAAPPAPSVPADEVEIEPLSTMRRKIAEHMVMSKHTSPHVTTVFEVDMTKIARLIKENKAEFQRENGVKLTYLPFIMKGTISALREYPIVNASIQGDKIHYFKRVHLGIAVALDEGLLVPVVRDAEDLSLIGLARAVTDLATRARAKKLQPDEVRGGTFTITNHGVFGSLFATPVINQPQSGILGVGTVTKRPVVLPDTDSIAVRSMMYLGLSFDHRLIDGATADRFVAHIKQLLEDAQHGLDS